MKNLRLLLKLRSWLKSGTLKTGGLVVALGQAQMWFASEDGMRILDLLAGAIGLTTGTATGLVTTLIGGLILWHRARTERSLADK